MYYLNAKVFNLYQIHRVQLYLQKSECTCGYTDVFNELLTQPQQASIMHSLFTRASIITCIG